MSKRDYRFRMSQSELEYTYESAKGRMEYHPDIADKYQSIVLEYSRFKNEKDALETAINMEKENPYTCQIWAKIEKSDGVYRIMDWWIVTDDWKVKQAAEYIGMAQMYDETRLSYIIDNNVKIDDVIAAACPPPERPPRDASLRLLHEDDRERVRGRTVQKVWRDEELSHGSFI